MPGSSVLLLGPANAVRAPDTALGNLRRPKRAKLKGKGSRVVLAEEIIDNAITAAVHDPRFSPVKAGVLVNLVYSVDILSVPQPAKKADIDPKKKGLLVIALDGRRGLLLPDLPGIETAEEQIDICRKKAGIAPDEKVSFQTFTVERHGKHSE